MIWNTYAAAARSNTETTCFEEYTKTKYVTSHNKIHFRLAHGLIRFFSFLMTSTDEDGILNHVELMLYLSPCSEKWHAAAWSRSLLLVCHCCTSVSLAGPLYSHCVSGRLGPWSWWSEAVFHPTSNIYTQKIQWNRSWFSPLSAFFQTAVISLLSHVGFSGHCDRETGQNYYLVTIAYIAYI